jgi:hypothetical protein
VVGSFKRGWVEKKDSVVVGGEGGDSRDVDKHYNHQKDRRQRLDGQNDNHMNVGGSVAVVVERGRTDHTR